MVKPEQNKISQDKIAQDLAFLSAGCAQILPQNALIKKLEQGKKLNIKLGMDPTSPGLHLGHAVVLSKMRQFQDLGHNIIFLIGDFTARIGDPTGRSKTRPPLTQEDIEHNMRTYFEQVGRVLDADKITVRYNSEWLNKLSSIDMVQLCGKVTLARLIERDDFSKRFAQQEPIGLHEFLYPLLQGYDSVALHADVELGGTDQTFNLLMGRFLQEQYGQEPQLIMTTPLLEGLDGVQKMSKSLGNAISLNDEPNDAFGKLMSMPDTLMWRYFELLLYKTAHEVSVMQERIAAGTLSPIELKKEMARDILTRFWGQAEAQAAYQMFESVFQKKDYSKAQEVSLPGDTAAAIWIVDLLKLLNAISSSSEARRLIESGAVTIDGVAVTDFKAAITWVPGMIVKAGKHKIYKIN
jgi:tyrosyl-tRNA synthetase